MDLGWVESSLGRSESWVEKLELRKFGEEELSVGFTGGSNDRLSRKSPNEDGEVTGDGREGNSGGFVASLEPGMACFASTASLVEGRVSSSEDRCLGRPGSSGTLE